MAWSKALTEYCEFSDSLDNMLRDHLACSISNEQLQQWLLSEPHPTLTKAMEISQNFEITAEDAHSL